jgi:tetratricopeptide (TPR) repeat protein
LTTVPEALTAALRHHQAGRLSEAGSLYREVLAIEPANADALHLLGVIARQTGHSEAAVAMIGRAISLNPRAAPFHGNLGVALAELGRLDEAEASYREALRLGPDKADPHRNLGDLLRRRRRPAEAEACYREALRCAPNDAATHAHLAHVLDELGRHAEAAASFREALRLRPDDLGTLLDLGNALRRAGRFEDAITCYRDALLLQPDLAQAHNNLGITLRHFGRFDEAVASCREAVARMPQAPEAHNNLGMALRDLNRVDEAEASCRQALRLRPDYAGAHANLGAILLSSGRLPEGWTEYEWRWKVGQELVARPFAQPLWTGEPLADCVVLIHAEQGFGDTLQFCRYVPLLTSEARVILEVPQPLVRLLSRLPGVEQVVPHGEPLPAFDMHCPMLSLPYAFGTTRDDIPNRVPYLAVDPSQSAIWRQRLASLPGLRVGVAWSGNSRPSHRAANATDRRRSIPFDRFAQLLGVPGISFVSLQKDAGPDRSALPAGITLHDWMHELDDFADTAALMAALDLVVTVDTAIVHLAGALAKPVWLLNRFDTCWRWLLDRSDSPWYPTLRQFRQPSPGDWDSVVADVRAALMQQAR